MTTPKVKCEICGYEGDYGVEIYGGLCQDCGENSTTIKLKRNTKILLDHQGIKSETYDEIIKKLINNKNDT